jgi:ribosomal protein S18 acetylase RimI-like enzyme
MEIRPYSPHDLEPVVDLLGRSLHADPITPEVFQRKVLLDYNFDPNGCMLAWEDKKLLGFMLGMTRKFQLEDGVPDFDRSWITLAAVDEGYRRRGIGTELLRAVEKHLQSKNVKSVWVSSYAPNYFIPGIDVNAYPAALEFFKKNGYAEIYRPLSMDSNLVHLETPEWVKEKERLLEEQGVVLETYQPWHTLPLLDFMKQHFAGDWQRYIRETMTKISLAQVASDQVFVAHENGKVLGFCQHEGERFGPFGVDPSERGRGIGVALLLKCLHSMRAKGWHNAWFLWTDDKVAKLYAEAGFKESRRFALLRKMWG